jgi:DNA-binding NarL/FixJ family response regulator
MFARGQDAETIAGNLRIHPSTVLAHKRDIMEKLNIHSFTELLRYASKHGLAYGSLPND